MRIYNNFEIRIDWLLLITIGRLNSKTNYKQKEKIQGYNNNNINTLKHQHYMSNTLTNWNNIQKINNMRKINVQLKNDPVPTNVATPCLLLHHVLPIASLCCMHACNVFYVLHALHPRYLGFGWKFLFEHHGLSKCQDLSVRQITITCEHSN